MGKVVYLSVACDTDPDLIPHQSIIYGSDNRNHIWRGISVGIANFRRLFQQSTFFSEHGQLCVSWLLRADRQIYELYNDASFCFRHFENIWSDELTHGNEIGWHPHLYRWEKRTKQWEHYLGYDDDLQILSGCFASLRKCIDVTTVRTGCDYHSNRLMRFFDEQGIIVDASAIPGSRQTGQWFYDWEGTPRYPYHPSVSDYRRPAKSNELSLNIIEMPMLVRALPFPLHFLRFCKRNIKAIPTLVFTDYESARWQGQIITRRPSSFYQAIAQTLTDYSHSDCVFINTYFHSNDLLLPKLLSNFLCNLESLSYLVERKGYDLISVTLRDLAPIAKEWIKHSLQK